MIYAKPVNLDIMQHGLDSDIALFAPNDIIAPLQAGHPKCAQPVLFVQKEVLQTYHVYHHSIMLKI